MTKEQHHRRRARWLIGVAAAALSTWAGAASSQPAPSPSPAPTAPPSTTASAAPPVPPPASSITPGSAPQDPVPVGAQPYVPGARQKVPGPPDPTPEQLEALRILQEEAAQYEEDARDYRRSLNRVIRHHYQEKRRRILSSLDREIDIETKGLKEARVTAIEELERFITKYSGEAADPEATPDAMFRLAALYEEREREKIFEAEMDPNSAPPLPNLDEAIALYRRIMTEYPRYRELAAVYYYLGHAHNDMAQLEESQYVWRSLVCHNRYPSPLAQEDSRRPDPRRMAQDHDREFWLGWFGRHPKPMDVVRDEGGELDPEDEEKYVDPYPDDCAAIAQNTLPGEDPRYVAEIWWRIGDHHFEKTEFDEWGGPYNLNRARSAYLQSMRFKKPPVFGVAMYKLAWTYYKQQRYRAAVDQFVELLEYTDEQERKTGNPGADFRAEAYAYIAGSLMYIDFDGPEADDPFIARDDIFDLEPDPVVIEEKMHVAIDRVQDPGLIPQERPWTIDIYKALAFEYKEYNHYQNSIELNELILAKYPMHRDAPAVQNAIAETYEALAQQTQGTEREKYQKLALDARGKLVDYVATPATTPAWVEANKEDPEAIRAAEQLVRGGLRRAAADHTNSGRAFIARARRAATNEEREAAFGKALDEYRLAARAWGGYLLQDENAEDAYESRFWLADAYTNAVLIQIQLGRDPNPEEAKLAKQFARDVRDSNEDDRFLQPAAMMLVRVAQQQVKREHQKFEETGGAEGFAERSELQRVGEGDAETFEVISLPPPLREMITAFDEYISRVPLEAEPDQAAKNHDRFAYLGGEIPFFYGQFKQARARLQPIYVAQCGKTKYGYLAWEKLLTMANQENDFESSRILAEASKKKSCAVTDAQKTGEVGLRDPTLQRGFYQEAAAAYTRAEGMDDGPERRRAWRKAAELYEEALKQAPGRKEAPEAAILGATAYKQIGEYDKAIEMYALFIKEYGNEERLARLEKGDPANGTPPDKDEYEARIEKLKIAYDALAEAYVLFFDYEQAAQTYEKIASIKRFSDADQRSAAQNAVFLYANIGARDKVEATKNEFYRMNPSAAEKAEIEWRIASADYKQWDSRGQNQGTNATARRKALASMDAYFLKFNRDRGADPFTVQAAFYASKLRRAGGDTRAADDWCRKTVTAFGNYKSSAGQEEGRDKAMGTRQADMAAECAYRAIDRELKRDFDYDAGHYRFKGELKQVRDGFTECVDVDAKKYSDRLKVVIDSFGSRKWAVAARARQGSLLDTCRSGLYNAREPGLKLYTAKEEKVLKQLDDLCVNQGSDEACDKYDDFTSRRRLQWQQTRSSDLDKVDKAMVRAYVTAMLLARQWKVNSAASDRGVSRLAFFTDIIGDQKLRQHTDGLQDPVSGETFVYRDKMFLRMRRGLGTEVSPGINPAPLPAIPAP
ncbi:MAG: hypothetical protein AAGN82_20035 [Myxococcota bacterium]